MCLLLTDQVRYLVHHQASSFQLQLVAGSAVVMPATIPYLLAHRDDGHDLFIAMNITGGVICWYALVHT